MSFESFVAAAIQMVSGKAFFFEWHLVRSTPKELKPLAGGRAQRKPPVPMSQVKCIPAGCQHPTSILVSLVNPALIPPGYGSMGILSGGGATLTTG